MKADLNLPPRHNGDLWLFKSPEPTRVHRHDELEFNLVVRGQGIYLLNGRRIALRQYSMLWLFPAQDHVLLEKSVDYQMWVFVVKPSYLQQICSDAESEVLLAQNPGGHFCRHLSQDQAEPLLTLFDQVCSAKNDTARFNIGLGYVLLTAWSVYRTASIAPLEAGVDPSILKAAYLIRDGGQVDNLNTLAQRVGLSPSGLSRLFKRQTGVSLTAFRNRCRVERFLELYQHGQTKTMLTAAFEAGFGSYAQFYRVFKYVMGLTPSAYRRSLQSWLEEATR